MVRLFDSSLCKPRFSVKKPRSNHGCSGHPVGFLDTPIRPGSEGPLFSRLGKGRDDGSLADLKWLVVYKTNVWIWCCILYYILFVCIWCMFEIHVYMFFICIYICICICFCVYIYACTCFCLVVSGIYIPICYNPRRRGVQPLLDRDSRDSNVNGGFEVRKLCTMSLI